jgi:putative hemolysin
MIEFLVVLALVGINAILSGTEMAVVAARRSRLQTAADKGDERARRALELRRNPERFLATVQVGITLVGAVAGAFGGASLSQVLEPLFAAIPGCAPIADEAAFVVVVALITFLSVVLGELIPKSIALRHAERIAITMAGPVLLLEKIASPAVWLFVKSSNLVLRPFHDSTNFIESRLTREDLAAMVTEASNQSDVAPNTRLLLDRAMVFSSLRVTDVMVHRRLVVALPVDADEQALRQALVVAGHRRVPVFETSRDHVVGYILRDDVVAHVWDRVPLSVASLRRPAFYLPETSKADFALLEMQRRRTHLAIVIDEHGLMQGIVTLEDLLEELVGEIDHERDATPDVAIRAEADGRWIVAAAVDIRELARATGVRIAAPENVRSVGGFVLHLAGNVLPERGSHFAAGDVEFEVLDVSPLRIDAVRVTSRRRKT